MSAAAAAAVAGKWCYAVCAGRQAGVYGTWDECKAVVMGYSGARYKRFRTAAEADAWLRHVAPVRLKPSPRLSRKTQRQAVHHDNVTHDPLLRALLPPPPPAASTPATAVEGVHVYADGSCTHNGQEGARAGIGVFFGPDDPRNLSLRLPPAVYRQTNQVAEIVAAHCAVAGVPADQAMTLFTDSTYVVKALNEWRVKWKREQWQQALVNRDLLRALSDAVDARTGATHVRYIRAHVGHYGNTQADAMATAGAAMDAEDASPPPL